MSRSIASLSAAVALSSLQVAFASIPLLACLPPKVLIQRLGAWGATGVGMVGTELTSIFLMVHAVSQYLAWRVGGTALIPWIIYRPLTLAVILSNSLVFLYASTATRKICEDAVNSFREQLFDKIDRNGLHVEEHIRSPTPFSLSFFIQSFIPFWKPWNVTEINDITYVTPEELVDIGKSNEHFVQLDVIRKDTGYRNRPVFPHNLTVYNRQMYIHGGAWQFGDKRKPPMGLTMPICWHMASSQNWVVVNVNYRMAPKACLADMVEDLEKALRWIKQNAAIHGGDPNYIVVSGGSAGGHLSAAVALRNSDDVKGYVGFYPVTNPLNKGVKGFSNWFETNLIRGKNLGGVPSELWADPLVMVQGRTDEEKAGIPPMIIIQYVSPYGDPSSPFLSFTNK
ncbi:TLE member 5 [Dinochytrium kinnereticum]|nr:TLE member 5 [Dinochytrium kinnereticum]